MTENPEINYLTNVLTITGYLIYLNLKERLNMKIVIGLIMMVAIILVVFYTYYGGFRKIDIQISKTGGETLVYEKIKGDYRQSSVVMDKIYDLLLKNDKVQTYRGFGIYYDNPEKVEKSKLRSEAGCVIEHSDLEKISTIKENYSVKEFPKKKYIVTEFLYKGKISVFFSIMRVYPALREFARQNGYKENSPVMEIYDIPNEKILYRKQIIKK